jgi:hypothetical protein
MSEALLQELLDREVIKETWARLLPFLARRQTPPGRAEKAPNRISPANYTNYRLSTKQE